MIIKPQYKIKKAGLALSSSNVRSKTTIQSEDALQLETGPLMCVKKMLQYQPFLTNA